MRRQRNTTINATDAALIKKMRVTAELQRGIEQLNQPIAEALRLGLKKEVVEVFTAQVARIEAGQSK